jgi:hypothetical protein
MRAIESERHGQRFRRSPWKAESIANHGAGATGLKRNRSVSPVKMSRGFHPIAVECENILLTGRLTFFWAPPDLPRKSFCPSISLADESVD